jgi:hypothetical protein
MYLFESKDIDRKGPTPNKTHSVIVSSFFIYQYLAHLKPCP